MGQSPSPSEQAPRDDLETMLDVEEKDRSTEAGKMGQSSERDGSRASTLSVPPAEDELADSRASRDVSARLR